jgi:hypothetical protein
MGLAHGNLYDKEEHLALTFVAVINAYISLWYKGKGELTHEIAEVIVKQFMHGIFS